VEIRTGSAEPGPAPTLEPVPIKRDLADAGLRAEVAGLERRQGYLMARLAVTNPTGQAIALAPGSGLTPEQADPNGLSLADRTDQLRRLPCHTSARAVGFYYLANPRMCYTVEFLDRVDTAAVGEGKAASTDVANRVQRHIAAALGYECTMLTRKDKYLMLVGNDGAVAAAPPRRQVR